MKKPTNTTFTARVTRERIEEGLNNVIEIKDQCLIGDGVCPVALSLREVKPGAWHVNHNPPSGKKGIAPGSAGNVLVIFNGKYVVLPEEALEWVRTFDQVVEDAAKKPGGLQRDKIAAALPELTFEFSDPA